MNIGQIMNPQPTTILDDSTLRQAARILHESLASDLMVVDADGAFVGVLSEGDIVRHVMPRYEGFTRVCNLYEAFGMTMEQAAEAGDCVIDALVIHDPITVSPEDDAVKAAGTMVSKQIRRLPVTDGGKLVGTLSRADIASAVLA